MNDCKAWDDFALEANNLLTSMTDVGELSASTMEIYPRDLLAISWAASKLTRLIEVSEAIRPFAHDDLCVQLGGNASGDDSIIFQRNNAKLTLGDCRKARASLLRLEEG